MHGVKNAHRTSNTPYTMKAGSELTSVLKFSLMFRVQENPVPGQHLSSFQSGRVLVTLHLPDANAFVWHVRLLGREFSLNSMNFKTFQIVF